MIINKLLDTLLKPYLLHAGPTEGGADRGDDFTPTLDEDEEDEVPDTKAKKDDAEEEEDEALESKKDDEEEDDEEEDKKDRKPRIRIPKERLDQEIQKRRAAEQRAAERIAALEQQIAQQKKDANVEALESELTKLDEQYDDAIADGEKAKAKELKAKMREIERKLSRAEAIQASLQGKQAAVAEIRYDMAVSDIESDYPALNPDNEREFDPDKAEEVMDLLEAYKARGHAPDVALRKAVRYVMGPPPRLVEKIEEVPDVEKDGLRRKEAVKDDRKLDARKKAVDATKKQPPSSGKVGLDSDKMGGGKMSSADITKMTQEQFAKLDDETKAKLRGDDI